MKADILVEFVCSFKGFIFIRMSTTMYTFQYAEPVSAAVHS